MTDKKKIGAVIMLTALSACGANVYLGGELEIEHGINFIPTAFDKNWKAIQASGDYTASPRENGAVAFSITSDGIRADGEALFQSGPDGSISADYKISSASGCEFNTLCIQVSLDGNDYRKGTIVSDGREHEIPDTSDDPSLFYGETSKFTLRRRDGAGTLTITPDSPVCIFLQDNRKWNSDTMSLRIMFPGHSSLKAGETKSLRFNISAQTALMLEPYSGPVRIKASDEWIPMEPYQEITEGSPLDFSRIVPRDIPAGKYGYPVPKGQAFEFEKLPGTEQRFYGVNFCFSANFLEMDDARKLAERLARIGYNAVRIHHYDGGLVEGSRDGTAINPSKMAMLDNVIAACIENGLYITTDMYVSRQVPYRAIGIDKDGFVEMDDYKALVPVNEEAYKNLENFSRQFLEHVNPHTGRRYADEPALAWISMVNEGNLGNHGVANIMKFPEWKNAWKEWLDAKKISSPEIYSSVKYDLPDNIWAGTPETTAFLLFLQEKESAFAERFSRFLKEEMHCKALLTDMNCWMNPVGYQITRSEQYGYVDDHFYVDHPQFLEQSWRLPSKCPNSNPFKGRDMGTPPVVFRRLLDKPFTITEYNFSAPGRFRGVGGISTGALAALQNWAGVWRFAWSHVDKYSVNPALARISYFDISGDPLSLAAERASICLFLRRDAEPLKKTFSITIPKNAVSNIKNPNPPNSTEWGWAAWYAKFGTVVADDAPAGSDWNAMYPDAYSMSEDQFVKSAFADGLPSDGGNEAVRIDRSKGVFIIDTERTCGGFTESGSITAGAISADVGNVPATVWASSIDGKPIGQSGHILLTHLTDVQNTDIQYADSRLQIMLEYGRLPHLMRNGKAEISLNVGNGDFEVRALSSDGTVKSAVKSVTENGVLKFVADVGLTPKSATYLYEIIKR